MKTIELTEEQVTTLSRCIIAQMQSNNKALLLLIDDAAENRVRENNEELYKLYKYIND